MSNRVEEKLKTLPDRPGVYIFKGPDGKILYVGKAVSLRKRVLSYFQPGRPLTSKLMQLVEQTADLEWILTGSEAEALLYEAGLIKEKQPKYNVLFRDDKSYPYLKITAEEPFPRLFIGRVAPAPRHFWSDDHRGHRGMPNAGAFGLASRDGAGSVIGLRRQRPLEIIRDLQQLPQHVGVRPLLDLGLVVPPALAGVLEIRLQTQELILQVGNFFRLPIGGRLVQLFLFSLSLFFHPQHPSWNARLIACAIPPTIAVTRG